MTPKTQHRIADAALAVFTLAQAAFIGSGFVWPCKANCIWLVLMLHSVGLWIVLMLTVFLVLVGLQSAVDAVRGRHWER